MPTFQTETKWAAHLTSTGELNEAGMQVVKLDEPDDSWNGSARSSCSRKRRAILLMHMQNMEVCTL